MKKNRLTFCFLFFLPLIFNPPVKSFGQDWQELSSDHFIVYFTGDEKFAKEILDKSEVYYNGIAMDMNYPRYSEFWIWEKKVKIYIYPERASYLKATSQPDWSQGMADYTEKKIVSYMGSTGFTESILPHEMAHLIFRDFVGFKGEIPLWIDEGVAQWNEQARRSEVRATVKDLFNKNLLLSIEDMINLDIRHVKFKDALYIRSTKTKEGKQETLFLTADGLISTYYLESVSLIDFLITAYGADSFSYFCRQLRDGKPLREALSFVYAPHNMRSFDDLEQQWRKYIEEKN